ncbi:hypothetical protein LCGC14_2218070 [marine sediment metagenome]|uniref:Uncharacterized protein n=1 Tax=marine sediment metagenome TaxID=412755 RepID=A0A0F9G7D5_9ZZZZ
MKKINFEKKLIALFKKIEKAKDTKKEMLPLVYKLRVILRDYCNKHKYTITWKNLNNFNKLIDRIPNSNKIVIKISKYIK